MHRAWRQEARSGGDAAAEPRQAAACTQPLLGCKFCRPQPGEAGRAGGGTGRADAICGSFPHGGGRAVGGRSEEHTSELQSLMRISYAVFCLKEKSEHIHTRTK